MEKTSLNLEHIYHFSKLLSINCIKKEIDEIISGYNVDVVIVDNGIFNCFLSNDSWDCICFCVDINKNIITILKYTDNIIESINIDENLLMVQKIVEKRENGLIYSTINKKFNVSKSFKNDFILVDLNEKRLVFAKDNLERLMNDINFDKTCLNTYLLKFKSLETKTNLNTECNLYTEFSTSINHYFTYKILSKIKENTFSIKTYVNNEDISEIYNLKYGKDKLHRIYDLYHGKINQRNEDDICEINLGFLSTNAYDLKTLIGITPKEDAIVGKLMKNDDAKYLNYLKELLKIKFSYNGNLELTRDSVLNGITYKTNAQKCDVIQTENELTESSLSFTKILLNKNFKR